MATGESTAVKHIDGFEKAGDALVDGVKKVGLRLMGEAVPFGSHIPAVRRQLEEDATARRQEWYDNLTPERRARFDAYVAEDGAVLKAAGRQRRELMTMFPDMPGGPGEELENAATMVTTPGLITGYGPIYRLGQLPRGHFVPNYRLAEMMLHAKGGRWDRLNREAKFKILRETGLQKDPVSNGEWTYVPPEFPRLDARQWASARLETPYKANVQVPLAYQIAYPSLYEIPVKVTKVDDVLKVDGTYRPRPGSIDVSGFTLHDANETLAHELAHYTGPVAGLPPGGCRSLRKLVMDHPEWFGQDAYEKAIRFQKIRSPRDYEQFKYISPERTDSLKNTDEIIQELYDRDADYTFYRMLSGEVRARAAEVMSRIPAKERTNVLLEDFMPPDTGNFVDIMQDAKGGEASDVHVDSRGGDSIRAAEEGGEAAQEEAPQEEVPQEEAPQEEVPQEEAPQEGGPRIVINPEVFHDKRDALCVAMNEAFRIIMEMNGFDPVSEPTPAQRRFFADTAYANDEVMLRRTIIARICTFDTSIGEPSKGEHTGHSESTAPTDEQIQEAIEFLHTVLEIGAPQNEWEQSAVQRIIERLESGAKVSGVAEEAPDDPDSGDLRQTQGALGGGMTDDELAEQGLSVNENFGKSVEELGKIPVKGPAEEEDKWKAWREARERGNFTTHSQDGVDENGFKIGVEIPEEWKKMNTPQTQAPQAPQAPQAQVGLQPPQLQPPQLQLPQYTKPLGGSATAQASGATGEQKGQNEQGIGNKRAQAKGIHKDGNNYVDANGRRIGFSDYSWYGLS